MKKNTMMRIAAILLVCVLASTCGISGTFAKYVTEGSSTDTARVAKWGVVVTAENNTLFTTDYKTDATGTTFTGEYSVSSAGTDDRENVVAPGTSDSLTNITITGTPEVAVAIKYDATVTLTDNWKDKDGNFYCPLIITITNGTATKSINGTAYTDKATFLYEIENAIESVNAQYAPNTNLATIDSGADLQITWSWPFSTSDANDVKDTYLGDQASADNAARITILVEVTVTQVD